MIYAHSSNNQDTAQWQTLADHLKNVGDLAAAFAKPFGASEWARAAGVLHDLGKGCDEFQKRLMGKHPPIDHSIAGAATAMELLVTAPLSEGAFLAPLIAGHHAGLANYDSENEPLCKNEPLRNRLSNYQLQHIPHPVVSADIESMIPEPDSSVLETVKEHGKQRANNLISFCSFTFFTLGHLLFSALVDADWLDTERFMNPDAYKVRLEAQRHQEPLSSLRCRLDKHLASFRSDSPVNSARAAMLGEARRAATFSPGIFELNMPTGSGKTLTSMAFALDHALANSQERIIYAIPFMSIVEQNARVFKEVLGEENVVEHVSSYDYGFSEDAGESGCCDSEQRGTYERTLTQNWNSPVVVTTNVQLFESLFSSAPSRSRKVHNIANSVIVLDEVQTLPDSLLKPTLAMLETLVAIANVTVLLCTATQPGLDSLWPFGAMPKKIISCPEKYDYAFGNRVNYDVSHMDLGNEYTLQELVQDIVERPSALCIVSSRKAARIVYERLKEVAGDSESVFHLSAMMVPEHRTKTIDTIKRRLNAEQDCYVVSTQLVEAGVDLDFPVVFREIAGMDSIVQAAGRCNREGKMETPGDVIIFDCEEFSKFRPSSPNWLSKMRGMGANTIRQALKNGEDPFGSDAIRKFFDQRHQSGDLDASKTRPIFESIAGDRQSKYVLMNGRFPYESISARYRFVADDTVSVFVPWGDDGEKLLESVGRGDQLSMIYPRIQRRSVSVPIYMFGEYERSGAIRRVDGFPVPVLETRDGSEQLYKEDVGLIGLGEGENDVLVVV